MRIEKPPLMQRSKQPSIRICLYMSHKQTTYIIVKPVHSSLRSEFKIESVDLVAVSSLLLLRYKTYRRITENIECTRQPIKLYEY